MATATLAETALPKLSNEEISRYSRHLILPEVGMEGQQKLKAAKVLCVGTGGLGAPLALYLAAAGVGTLGLVDFDTVDASNLQRQIIHSTATVGKLKVDSAEIMLKGLNPFMNVVKHNTMLTSANALEIFKDYDIIADGTDNFQTRYLVNDACVLLGKPNAYGSIFRFEGQASSSPPRPAPATAASIPNRRRPAWCPPARRVACSASCPASSASSRPPKSSSSSWVLETALQAGSCLIDALGMNFRTLKLRKNPACPACGTHEIKQLIDYDQFCGIEKPAAVGPLEVARDKAVGEAPIVDGIPQISVETLKKKIDAKEDFFLLDVREPHEIPIANLGAPFIPVGELEKRIGELAAHKDHEIVVHCRSGARSQKAALILKNAGFKNVENLAGGILAWADKIDPTMPKY
jgi:molybdopterin/thiamine biosynthesis adenylyltransferase/rhodanese-related sulfurtransferase